MRFNKELLFLLILYVVWLAGCAAPTPRQSAIEPSETSTATNSLGEPAISANAMRQYERALAAMKAKRNKQAERMLLAMTRSYPELAGPYVNLGIIYYRTGRLQEAETAFKKAKEISPNRADVYNHLGIVLRETGRFSEAREVYEHALELDPLHAYARLNLGILFDLYLLDADSALHHYEVYQSLMSVPDEDVAKWIVDLKRRMRRSQKTAVRQDR